MAQYEFLSDPWLTEVKKIVAESPRDPAGNDLVVNVLVTDGPDGEREMHLANGLISEGMIDGAPTKLTVPYSVAKDMFISGDQQAAMQALMSGQLKVEGDMTRLMAMQQGGNDPATAELQERLKAMTVTD